MDARGKEKRKPRATLSFLSALQTSQVHPQLYVRTAKSMNQLFYNIASGMPAKTERL